MIYRFLYDDLLQEMLIENLSDYYLSDSHSLIVETYLQSKHIEQLEKKKK